MAECQNLCTAEKCQELEARIANLEQALNLLESSFEAHTQQDIPIAHNYNPDNEPVDLSDYLKKSDLDVQVDVFEQENNSAVIKVQVIDVSDEDTLLLPDSGDLSVSVDVFEQSDGNAVIKVQVNEESDEDTLLLSQLTENNDDTGNGNVTHNINFDVTGNSLIINSEISVNGESASASDTVGLDFAIDLALFGSSLQLSGNFMGSSFNDAVQLGDLIQTVFITEQNEMECDFSNLENLLNNLDNKINQIDGIVTSIDNSVNDVSNTLNNVDNDVNNINNKVDIIDDAVTTEISGTTPIDFTCPANEEEGVGSTPSQYFGTGLIGLHSLTQTINQNLLTIFSNTCNEGGVLAAPDWWQVRIGANRPQLVCTFRKGATRTYHSITIPHPVPVVTVPPSSPLLPEYQKGNWQGTIVLNDNSKFIINCASKTEAAAMCNIAATFINSAYLPSPFKIWITERRGEPVGQDQMFPATVMYYSTGQKNLMPDWRVSVSSESS